MAKNSDYVFFYQEKPNSTYSFIFDKSEKPGVVIVGFKNIKSINGLNANELYGNHKEKLVGDEIYYSKLIDNISTSAQCTYDFAEALPSSLKFNETYYTIKSIGGNVGIINDGVIKAVVYAFDGDKVNQKNTPLSLFSFAQNLQEDVHIKSINIQDLFSNTDSSEVAKKAVVKLVGETGKKDNIKGKSNRSLILHVKFGDLKDLITNESITVTSKISDIKYSIASSHVTGGDFSEAQALASAHLSSDHPLSVAVRGLCCGSSVSDVHSALQVSVSSEASLEEVRDAMETSHTQSKAVLDLYPGKLVGSMIDGGDDAVHSGLYDILS